MVIMNGSAAACKASTAVEHDDPDVVEMSLRRRLAALALTR